MSKLNILGAQRVKALQWIADSKWSEELKENSAKKPTSEQIEGMVMTALGVGGEYAEMQHLKRQLESIARSINDVTGVDYRIVNNSYRSTTAFLQKKQEILAPYVAEEKEIAKKWQEVKNQLWLCETLEEAKELVGI